MNVVMIGPFGLKAKSTMRERALPIARALVKQGHQVAIIVPPWDSPEDAEKSWEDNGVQIINTALPKIRGPLFHFQLTVWLVRPALRFQPDVIHLFKPKAYAGLAHLLLYVLKKLQKHDAKLVVDEDDWEIAWNEVNDYTPVQKRFFAWQEPWGLSHADVVTVASKHLHTLTEKFRASPEQIFYTPNCVRPIARAGRALNVHATRQEKLLRTDAGVVNAPSAEFLPKKASLGLHLPCKKFGKQIRAQYNLFDHPIILLYTRFAEFKLGTLVEVIDKVSRYLPAARWLVVGKGYFGEELELERLMRQKNLADKLVFTGWVPQQDLPCYFDAANVALHLYEDNIINRTKCSVKLLDLLAAGVPVVATKVGQNAEYIINRDTGFLVPPNDTKAIANALVNILDSDSIQYLLGKAAAQYVNQAFKWDVWVKIVEKAYAGA